MFSHDGFFFPLFFLFLLLFALKFPLREALLRIGLFTLLIFTITCLCNWVKIWVKRIRPCNDESVNSLMRMLHTPSDYSFFSGHASSSFAVTVLVFLLLKHKIKWAWLFFIWPILFSLSRLYLGVHYPLDVMVGALVGAFLAWLFFKSYIRLSHPA